MYLLMDLSKDGKMYSFDIGEIKIEHLEPKNCYPNSKEVCKVKYKDFEDSFSFKMGEYNHKVAQLQRIFDVLAEKIAKEI
jgi:hypothetical protein